MIRLFCGEHSCSHTCAVCRSVVLTWIFSLETCASWSYGFVMNWLQPCATCRSGVLSNLTWMQAWILYIYMRLWHWDIVCHHILFCGDMYYCYIRFLFCVFSCRCGDCQARSLPAPAVWKLDLYVHWYLKCVSCHFSILIVGIHAAFKYACTGIHTCYIIDWLMTAYIALFSALWADSALACGSTWVASFIARFLNIHQSGVLTKLQRWHGWCHMKLQLSQRKSCVHHTTMSLHAKPHM